MDDQFARAYRVLNRLADAMSERLEQIYTPHALSSFDTDDVRRAYGEWFMEDCLTRRYDRIDRLINSWMGL